MKLKKLIKKERKIWHNHFIPSLIAGIVVGVISFLYETTISNIILFASIGASAIILTNRHSHHLTKLRTIIIAYLVSIFISSSVYLFNLVIALHISINIFLLIFLVGLALYMVNAFHPPAITASLSFILLEQPLIDLLYLFIAVIILLIIVRLVIYISDKNLTVRDFVKEFKKSF